LKRRRGDFSNCRWEDLQEGDVILLKRGETCPADVLVLDTNTIVNKEAVCYVDTNLVNGITELTRKKALNLTKRTLKCVLGA
jgi:magnesium-transporting ATPase (P-type)